MISVYRKENTRTIVDSEGGAEYSTVELRGLSTDTKPTEIGGKKIDNGSTFIEVDTGKVYMYDLENKQWNEV